MASERDGTWFLPPAPRHWRGQRALKISARALHVLCAGTWAGGQILQAGPQGPWLLAALASGVLLLGLDLWETGAFLLQVRGLVVLLKLAVLASLPLLGAAAGWVLAGLIILSVVSSHAPASVRYRLLAGAGSVNASSSRG